MTPADIAAALAASKMQDRIALSFAGNEPDRIDEYDEWWTTPRSIAEQAMEAVLADPLWRVAEAAREYQKAEATIHLLEYVERLDPRWNAAVDACRRADVALREAIADLDANVKEMP